MLLCCLILICILLLVLFINFISLKSTNGALLKDKTLLLNTKNDYEKKIEETQKLYNNIKNENEEIRNKYSKILDIDNEVKKQKERYKTVTKNVKDIESLYEEKYSIYKKLIKEIGIYNDDLEMISVGLYKPVFNYDTSGRYKIKLEENYQKQKNLIKNNAAVYCSQRFEIDGSYKKGNKMAQKYKKLMLKAFNGLCDSAIAALKWNNLKQIESRIEKAYNDVNNLGFENLMTIEQKFYNLKIEEMQLMYGFEQKKYEEKEEQRRLKAQIREEEKAQREFEKAKSQAEKEEAIYQKALEQAKVELEATREENREGLNKIIEDLQEKLQAAQAKQRVISQAQLTKSGNVYIISNIGSFGENIYKIGMTRRLEPEERVNELGDASVPFKFDIHAMIPSNDAPALENKLHELFKDKSVNKVNYRKEFFKVSLEEIEKAVKDYTKSDIIFTKMAEAREYRESLAMSNIGQEKSKNKDLLPEKI